MTTTADTPSLGLVIAGESVSTGGRSRVLDPAAPDQAAGYAAAATRGDAERAVQAAVDAWPEWSALEPTERADRLVRALEGLADGREERARLLVRENGKVLAEARVELQVFETRCRLAASLAGELGGVRHLGRPEPAEGHAGREDLVLPPFRSEVMSLPIGPVTIIVPYNWPVAILAASLPYALVAGCPVVVKPPPTCPLAVVATLEILARALPPGVVNVVTGDNEAVAPVIEDPRITRIVFTGSTPAGQFMMQTAARNMTRVTLELGGNDPALVLEDAELDDAALRRLVAAAFLTTGQVCMGMKRLYVHRSRYDEVVTGMSDLLAHYRIGHGLEEGVTMGPLNNAKQRDIVEEMVGEARGSGTEVRDLGTIDALAVEQGGFFLPARLVLDPRPEARIVTEEQFGPALPVLPFDDAEQVVDRLNDEWAGLCSSVWTADRDRAAHLARRLRTGTTWVNNHNAVAQDDRAPFGGFRRSGIGRELGVEGLLEFTEAHTVTWSIGDD
ncbi:aldehyde dehydrogenase family protein [Nocardioides sp. cx-173]|uniref:aldehyde dehydrogenase family protein n=1 Tax=Nocardioides sp. cx-173 TaxID=2898796 RepID=UPI001E34FDB9|nr:aldehyde dehydrogenase family protein [Nocardioides sp. cx-173]MCD4524987.1 aldehyde dehydrogenase family protein [Nocardioides sp. cx-173]UGB40305.1 aldehyde dehydrogenase family protein [Nocardioides sp. cx-173]